MLFDLHFFRTSTKCIDIALLPTIDEPNRLESGQACRFGPCTKKTKYCQVNFPSESVSTDLVAREETSLS
jgi:hypothetical protein